jgi:hypothetical protein
MLNLFSRVRGRTRATRCAAIAGAALVSAALIGPVAANAQSLSSVAISTEASGDVLVLDVSGGSMSAGGGVIQWYGNNGSNQRWNFVQLPNGNEHIVNQKSGMCLATDGAAGHQLFQWYCNDSDPGEEWHGTLSSNFDSDFFKYGHTLVNPHSGLAMDVEGASRWAGARLVGWYNSGTDNQDFRYYQL